MLTFFVSILVRQKHWALFEHLSGIFPENQVLFSQKIKIESFLKRYDDFKNNLKNYIQISPLYSYVDDHFAMLKVFICIHCCHTTYTFLLALNPLKMFRINKKRGFNLGFWQTVHLPLP